MRAFRVLLDGVVLHERYECMGKYDVANELFPRDDNNSLANVAVYRDDAEVFGVVLLDFGNKRLLAEHL